MSTRKSPAKRMPVNNLYSLCLLSLSAIASNANKDFDASLKIDELVLEVCKRYVPDNKDFDLEEIISRVAMNMVYGWTDEIPF